jgi:hypothetical protein
MLCTRHYEHMVTNVLPGWTLHSLILYCRTVVVIHNGKVYITSQWMHIEDPQYV